MHGTIDFVARNQQPRIINLPVDDATCYGITGA
jgi:hypothetical protein